MLVITQIVCGLIFFFQKALDVNFVLDIIEQKYKKSCQGCDLQIE